MGNTEAQWGKVICSTTISDGAKHKIDTSRLLGLQLCSGSCQADLIPWSDLIKCHATTDHLGK